MFRTKRALVALASIALTASVAAPASAETDTFKDQKGDVRSGFDIRSVQVRNNGSVVKVWTKHRNLKRRGPADGGIITYLDTRHRNPGPEFSMGGPIGFNGDYALVPIRGWGDTGRPKPCHGLRYSVNYKHDRVRMAIPRRCLGNHVKTIRVAVLSARSGGRNDWAPRRHHFYPAVARG